MTARQLQTAAACRHSIVLPAFNEAPTICQTVQTLADFMEKRLQPYEIIVVDDGSTDGTADVAQASHPGVRAIRNGTNRGKGYSVKQGVLSAAGHFIFFTDVDLSVPVSFIPRLLDKLEQGDDVVIASRRHPGSRIVAPQPWPRTVSGVLFNTAVRLTLLPGLHDTQCGLKGFSREAAMSIFSHVSLSGWCFDVEILVAARELGYEISEIPVDWYNGQTSRVRPLSTLRETCRDLPRIYARKRRGEYRQARSLNQG